MVKRRSLDGYGNPMAQHEEALPDMVTPYEWHTIRRETGLVEHVCKHGVGHPNAGSMIWMEEETGDDGWGIHGCDGCCQLDHFPGTLEKSLWHAHSTIRELKEKMRALVSCVAKGTQ